MDQKNTVLDILSIDIFTMPFVWMMKRLVRNKVQLETVEIAVKE